MMVEGEEKPGASLPRTKVYVSIVGQVDYFRGEGLKEIQLLKKITE